MTQIETNFIEHEDLQPQPGESAKAFRAFTDYCGMGSGRSLRRLVQAYRGQSDGKPAAELPPTLHVRTLEGWSSSFRWTERVKTYSRLKTAAEREMDMQVIKEMKQRHIDFAMFLFKLAGIKLQEMALERSSSLTPSEARQFVEAAVRIEREARNVAAVELAVAAQEAAAAASNMGGRIRVIEVVKDYGNPNAAEDDDHE